MDYFSIAVCPLVDRSFYFLGDPPVGTGMYTHRMADGDAMGDKYPKNAKVYADKRSPGTKLPSLVANTESFLVVHKALKEVFEATGVPMECLPLAIHDPKKKLLSRDYFIVNPLGTFDALNRRKSKIEYDGEEIVGIDKLVLDARKLEKAPDLFRLKEDPSLYALSHRLAEKLKALKPTNVYLTKLEQG